MESKIDYNYFIKAIGTTDEEIEQKAISIIESTESEPSIEVPTKISRSKSPTPKKTIE